MSRGLPATRVLAISGSLRSAKNLLDWLVSFEPFINKPVAVLNASPRAHHADDALRATLKTMSALIAEQASISLPLLGAMRSEDEMVDDPAVSGAVRDALAALQRAVAAGRPAHLPTFPTSR
jgi:chromate reductase